MEPLNRKENFYNTFKYFWERARGRESLSGYLIADLVHFKSAGRTALKINPLPPTEGTSSSAANWSLQWKIKPLQTSYSRLNCCTPSRMIWRVVFKNQIIVWRMKHTKLLLPRDNKYEDRITFYSSKWSIFCVKLFILFPLSVQRKAEFKKINLFKLSKRHTWNIALWLDGRHLLHMV